MDLAYVQEAGRLGQGVTLGVLAAVGAVISWTLWRMEFVSTWCAFAALCSVVLFGWVRARARLPRRRSLTLP